MAADLLCVERVAQVAQVHHLQAGQLEDEDGVLAALRPLLEIVERANGADAHALHRLVDLGEVAAGQTPDDGGSPGRELNVVVIGVFVEMVTTSTPSTGAFLYIVGATGSIRTFSPVLVLITNVDWPRYVKVAVAGAVCAEATAARATSRTSSRSIVPSQVHGRDRQRARRASSCAFAMRSTPAELNRSSRTVSPMFSQYSSFGL